PGKSPGWKEGPWIALSEGGITVPSYRQGEQVAIQQGVIHPNHGGVSGQFGIGIPNVGIGSKLQSMIAQVLIGQERFVGKIGLPGSRLLGAVKQGHIELMSPYLLVPGNQVIQDPFVERRFPAGTPPLRIGASSGNRFGRPEIIVFYKIVPGLKG